MKPTLGRTDVNVEVIVGERFNVAMPLYRGILRYARERPRWHIRMRSSNSDRVWFRNGDTESDGILALCEAEDRQILPKLRGEKKPVVTFFADVPHAVLPTVALDERAIGGAAAAHLLGHGFRNFAFCGVEVPWSREREAGFCAAVVGAGCAPPEVMAGRGDEGRPKWSDLKRAKLSRWVARLRRPVGIMAHNDELGVQVVEAALGLGWSVPEQCAVVGVDDDEVTCESAAVPLSSVDTDLPAMGYAAAAMLDALLGGAAPPPTPPIIPPRGVRVRASSNVLAFEDRELREAVRLIRSLACKGVTVTQVARAVSISPRSLQLKFQRELRCRPGDEIRRVRLAQACSLLVESDLILREVAWQSGYKTLPQLCVAFKRQYGLTLQEYRRSSRRQAPPG